MQVYIYPTSADLNQIEQIKIPVLTMTDPLFEIMPIENEDADLIMWEQMDNYTGLQGVRGLNGEPSKVQNVGGKRYNMLPGVYGEYTMIDETELTRRRKWGQFNTPINISDLVLQRQDFLLNRRIDRIRYIGWTLLTTGTFSTVHPITGVTLHTDSFSLQTASANVVWSTNATATPLKDLRACQLLGRGKSTNFGGKAKAYMNRTTFNNLVANTNQNDIAGRRVSGLLSPLNLGEINAVLMNEDLPTVIVYDEGYLDNSGTFQLFIPNGVVLIVGVRPGNAPVAKYKMTRNANNPDLGPGPYTRVIDFNQVVPRRIEVHDGHNGGPAIYFPGSIIILSC